MLPWESRRTRRSGRGRFRPDQTALEALEARALLAYTPLGFSLPDLSVSGIAAPAASWSGSLAVSVTVHNAGASTIQEPLNLAPGSTSSADSPATTVEVVASRGHGPHAKLVVIGQVAIPIVPQNSDVTVTKNLTLPPRPKGLPGDGGQILVSFLVNPTQAVTESDFTNNTSGPVPVKIAAPFPELVATGLDVPPVMQPGDTIDPSIRIDNLGPADTLPQGPVTVDLIASTSRTFNTGSSVVASYTVANIAGIHRLPEGYPSIGPLRSLSTPVNAVVVGGQVVTLPTQPGRYYLGVVIDPAHKLRQLNRIGKVKGLGSAFTLAHPVGPPIPHLPAAGVLVAGGGANNLPFPSPVTLPTFLPATTNPQFTNPGGIIPITPPTTTTTPTTTPTNPIVTNPISITNPITNGSTASTVSAASVSGTGTAARATAKPSAAAPNVRLLDASAKATVPSSAPRTVAGTASTSV